MYIDIEKLRKDLLNDSCGAFFGGGFGGALFEASELKNASPEKLIRIAENKGIDLKKYQV